MTGKWQQIPADLGRCECGKLRYESRKHAKQVARKIGHQGLSTYACRLDPAWFHLGHLPVGVKAGTMARSEIQPKQVAS